MWIKECECKWYRALTKLRIECETSTDVQSQKYSIHYDIWELLANELLRALQILSTQNIRSDPNRTIGHKKMAMPMLFLAEYAGSGVRDVENDFEIIQRIANF